MGWKGVVGFILLEWGSLTGSCKHDTRALGPIGCGIALLGERL
jgi:hypothetical protein